MMEESSKIRMIVWSWMMFHFEGCFFLTLKAHSFNSKGMNPTKVPSTCILLHYYYYDSHQNIKISESKCLKGIFLELLHGTTLKSSLTLYKKPKLDGVSCRNSENCHIIWTWNNINWGFAFRLWLKVISKKEYLRKKYHCRNIWNRLT